MEGDLMGYFMLGICAGIIATGLSFSIMFRNQLADWNEEEEEEEMTEEDLKNDGYQDLW